MSTRRAAVSGWLLCLPALAVFGCFFVGPALIGGYVSLHVWNGSSPQLTFVGLKNYRELLVDGVTCGRLGSQLCHLSLQLADTTAEPGYLDFRITAIRRGVDVAVQGASHAHGLSKLITRTYASISATLPEGAPERRRL